MPHQERSHRPQDAVLWPKTGDGPDAYGEPTRGDAVALKVRWTYVRRVVRGPDGQPVTTDATVITDREVALGGTMWLGRLADWADNDQQTVMEVVSYDRVPDVKGRVVSHVLGLAFYKRTVPEETP